MSEMTTANATKRESKESASIIYAALIAGLCSIIYELLIATTVSYFMGDSVKYFSITIGLYMAAMGLGSYVSKFVESNILEKFVFIEVTLGLIGGMSIPLLYFTYTTTSLFLPTYIGLTLLIGFLIGLEIPFLTRLMEQYQSLKSNIANILSFDYLGALIATIAFPFFLLPVLGIYQSSLGFGLINMSIAVVVLWIHKSHVKGKFSLFVIYTLLALISLIAMLVAAEKALHMWDQKLYNGRIVHSEQTPYQKVVLTEHKNDLRLYLDGVLQFSSVDEYRYHESLILLPMSLTSQPVKNVLLLGAGDGLAVRELLKYPEIEQITLVDLDPHITELATSNPHITKLNQNSLLHDKVTIVIGDAMSYLKNNQHPFDLIINDLPDPSTIELARLYSKQYYSFAKRNLSATGLMVTQATSPFFVRPAYWSIVNTIQESGFQYVYPYHTNVPSFGDWGFVISSHYPIDIQAQRPIPDGHFLSDTNLASLFIFDKDIDRIDTKVSQLDRPHVLTYYLDSWKYFSD